jgi:ParB/RepB/Spo0J family partition protein
MMLTTVQARWKHGLQELGSHAHYLVDVRPISLHAIEPHHHQPRTSQLTGIAELATSIRQYGLLHPIVVEPQPPDRYLLIAGARRVAAFRMLSAHAADDPAPANWASIPAVVRPAHATDRLVLAVMENVARQDLAEGELLTALRLLRDLKGWGPSEMARHLGVTRQWIQQYFRVGNDSTLNPLVHAGRLSVANAQEVRLARTPEARAVALEAALAGAPQRQIRALARQQHSAPESQGTASVRQTVRRRPTQAARSGTSPGVAEPPFPNRSPDAPEAALGRTPAVQSHFAPSNDHTVPRTLEPSGSTPSRAGAMDPADAAAALGLTVHLREFQLAKLILAAAERGTDVVNMADLIRVLRADLLTLEARIRSTLRQPQ